MKSIQRKAQYFMLEYKKVYINLLRYFYVKTKSIPGPFLIYSTWFLISTKPFQNSSVFARSIASSNATVGVKMSEYGTVP